MRVPARAQLEIAAFRRNRLGARVDASSLSGRAEHKPQQKMAEVQSCFLCHCLMLLKDSLMQWSRRRNLP